MSVQPEELVDPRDAFLARGALPVVATETAAISGVSVLIGAAVVSGFLLVRRELSKEHPKTPQEAKKAASHAWQKILPSWMKIAIPAVTQAYALGQTGSINYAELEVLAKDYADDLGEYVNKTSAEALMEGFAAQVNSGWNDSLAWERAKEAYGLDSRQMRSYISGLMAQDPKSYITDPIPTASRALINQAVSVRAERIGTNEAYKASQVGKNMVWLTMASKGDIPQGTRKKWVTAEDERVCEVCGPLDGRVIPLHWKFRANTGERFYAPGVHPNCRCRLEIVYPELGDDIVKAMPGDPYDRDRNGRFAATEQRSAMDVLRERRPATKTDPSNPLAILREPKSDALRYVGSNPAAREGALEVLRAGRQTASPMAVLAEAKAKEEEKASAPESKQKPKEKSESKQEQDIDTDKAIGTEYSVVWVNEAPLLRELHGVSPEEFMDPDWGTEQRLLQFSKQKLRVSGFGTDSETTGIAAEDAETSAFVKAYDEALATSERGRIALRSGDGDIFSIPSGVYRNEDSTDGKSDPVLFRVVEWKRSDERPRQTPPWLDNHDAVLEGDYFVSNVAHIDVPSDLLGADENQKVWVVTLKRDRKV